MNEPSLSTNKVSSETYRILWLRSFHAAMCFRLTIEPDGTSLLVTKKMSGNGSGERVLTKETRIAAPETRALIDDLERQKFWHPPASIGIGAGRIPMDR